MRQVLKSCWNANPDRRPKLGGVCLDLRTEIAGFEEKKSSRSLLDRTEHLRLHSTRSLLKAWLALGLPTSSRRLVTRLGEPSSELKPITEHETTESQENAILSLLEVPDDSQPEDAWDDRCLFGSAVECQMPSSWTDLSWQLSRVPESLELWQDGRGAERRHSCYLFKAELREPQVDLSAACFYYYQEAAQSHQIDDMPQMDSGGSPLGLRATRHRRGFWPGVAAARWPTRPRRSCDGATGHPARCGGGGQSVLRVGRCAFPRSAGCDDAGSLIHVFPISAVAAVT